MNFSRRVPISFSSTSPRRMWPLKLGMGSSNPQCKSGAGVVEYWPPAFPACFPYDFGGEHGLPWTQNTWQRLRTGKPRRAKNAALLPVGLTPMAATAAPFLESPTRHSTDLTKPKHNPGAKTPLPHSHTPIPTPHILHSCPQESPHTLKHLKTGAETREDGKISMQIFAAPCTDSPCAAFPFKYAWHSRMPVTQDKESSKVLSPGITHTKQFLHLLFNPGSICRAPKSPTGSRDSGKGSPVTSTPLTSEVLSSQ